ncbi:hypothetical protein G6F16_009629 [Rhizopus arrhizus]|nr:hypothetical protein G6F24_002415 [Rhizopus arrhizus]KAG0784898.1 hypothetical protein G6F21_009614 [Rhizopus arrhizus]KAG0786544.1 hypothetical protein G6F22_007595 [Rhizopus arrhizus]KAG0816014.1 hypothetical protein G6F20_003535 [Rhizopus arrhizus]KAG0825780.1 hypothetical protein G6F19_009645 [Rhizopus arrhizus]
MISTLFESSQASANVIQSTLENKQQEISFEPSYLHVKDHPTTTATSKPPNKIKFKEPVFAAGLHQNAYKKKKKADSSSDSDDDAFVAQQQRKKMTSKERRQMRNKISAKNFRERRKEYITQLEQKVEEHEKTIDELRKENLQLRKTNEQLMHQLLPHLSSPSNTDHSEELAWSSTESQSSPEPAPLASMPFQFSLDDVYDFNLLEQPEQLLLNSNSFDTIYLHHAVMPDLDVHRVLGEKMKQTANQNERQEAAKELLSEYPLLGAALMSIVLRHTMVLDYVSSIANQFSSANQEVPVEKEQQKEQKEPKEQKEQKELKEQKEQRRIKSATDEIDPASITEEDIIYFIFHHGFAHYALYRAAGQSHEQIMERWKKCLSTKSTCADFFYKKIKERRSVSESKGGNRFQTLQTYCKVAGTLLKHPKRMTQVSKVLKEKINFSKSYYTSHSKNQAALANPSQFDISTK